MWKNVFDVLKAVVVLLLLIAAIIALPFFLAAVVAILAGYMIYVIIRCIREEKEIKERYAKAREND